MNSILIYNSRPEHEFKRQTAGASGFDLCASFHDARVLHPGERLIAPTGIHVAMPLGVEAQVRGRSGLAAKHGVIAAPGTVDADYRGQIKVTLFNLGSSEFVVTPGMRIGQLVFAPVIVPWGDYEFPLGYRVEPEEIVQTRPFDLRFVNSLSDLPPSDRGTGGHGSTGLGGGK